MKNKVQEKGITLIALVITIIVLLILAGITISTLMGENGMLTRAENSRIKTAHGAIKDTTSLAYNKYMAKYILKKEDVRTMNFMEFAQSKGYVNEEGIINVTALIGNKLPFGNGTGSTDVYKLEEQDGEYIVNYYINETEVENVWQQKTQEVASEPEDAFEDFKEDPDSFTHEQQASTNDDRGIGTDGSAVNMDLWTYINYGDGTGAITGSMPTSTQILPAYSGEVNNKGTIIIPEYIYDYTNDEVFKVIEIGQYAFYDMDITNIKLPSDVIYIGTEAFNLCNELAEINNLSKVESVGMNAFNSTAWLNNQPEGDIYVGKTYYYYKGDMPAETTITIKPGTKSITRNIFMWETNLKVIKIPISLTSIGQYAFEYAGLTNVYYEGTAEQWGKIDIGYGNDALTSATFTYNAEI